MGFYVPPEATKPVTSSLFKSASTMESAGVNRVQGSAAPKPPSFDEWSRQKHAQKLADMRSWKDGPPPPLALELGILPVKEDYDESMKTVFGEDLRSQYKKMYGVDASTPAEEAEDVATSKALAAPDLTDERLVDVRRRQLLQSLTGRGRRSTFLTG